MVFDAVARHTSGILSMESFRKVLEKERPSLQTAPPPEPEENALSGIFGHFPTVREVEEYMIIEALKLAKGNQGMAASLLGITRQTLNNRLKDNRKQV
jgi:DNA-binding NtrC family response regulator